MSADEKTRWTVALIFAAAIAVLLMVWFCLGWMWPQMAGDNNLAFALPLVFAFAVLSPVAFKMWCGR